MLLLLPVLLAPAPGTARCCCCLYCSHPLLVLLAAEGGGADNNTASFCASQWVALPILSPPGAWTDLTSFFFFCFFCALTAVMCSLPYCLPRCSVFKHVFSPYANVAGVQKHRVGLLLAEQTPVFGINSSN